ncbi:MAG: ABC transporter permease [Anaerolineales bacterium]|uniref:ABC transporter permease n=1 Tax=Candidatus Villigracilis proximus TaxID=3140683 RepID=UPI003135AEAB|nr:ABC transporter permease [Anaerolineales bacterium]
MLFSENFKIAIRALRANKLRSILTMLGIVIGVATVVALLSIGKGVTANITSSIQSNGSNLLTVSPGRQQTGPGGGGSQQASYLYYADYQLLQRSLKDDIAAIVPSYQSSYLVDHGNDSFTVNVTGTTKDYQKTNSYEVAEGRFISDGDNKAESRVAVLGAETAKDLFGGLTAVGKTISIKGVKFEVVGVLEAKGSSGFGGSSDDAVFIPLETGYGKLFGSNATYNDKKIVNSISVSVASTEAMDNVSAQIEFLIRRAHKLTSSDELDFNVLSQSDLLSTLTSVTQTLTIFLGAIAGISLLVGGIGIMNIMLVSVTERTKEIGLRKAVGATKNQILTQFLIETVTLSLLGGIIGILLGVGLALLVTLSGAFTAVITADSILLAFTFALAIGVFFGIYPAYRAANLHPMVALRYE